MQTQKTGVFYINPAASGSLPEFPREYRKRPFSQIDRRFALLVAICAVVVAVPTIIMSMRQPSEELTEKEIKKIQERYAQLVLNQEETEPEEEEEGPGLNETKQDKKEEKKVDREKESFAEKKARKEATHEERRARREKISKEVGSAGIFAAITASGGGGDDGSSPVSDLLGASNAVSGLEGVSVSGGTFASANQGLDPKALSGRRGNRTSGVGIDEGKFGGKASDRQLASAGDVSISSEPAEISGDESQVQSSQACIQRIIRNESSKIKRMYETWLKRDPKLGGRIKVRFRILPNGSVTNTVIIQSTTNNSRFDQNALRYIGRWRFSECAPDSPLDIELPFVFQGFK
jgi:TonB family protein